MLLDNFQFIFVYICLSFTYACLLFLMMNIYHFHILLLPLWYLKVFLFEIIFYHFITVCFCNSPRYVMSHHIFSLPFFLIFYHFFSFCMIFYLIFPPHLDYIAKPHTLNIFDADPSSFNTTVIGTASTGDIHEL